MDSLIGQSLGRYRLDNLLGEGGMGAVFKAVDVALQRPVAIKVMHAQFSSQPDFQKRFLNEAQAAAKLDHPGIVKVFDFGVAQSRLYIVMEFLSGGNLRQLLQKLKAANQWIVLSEAVYLVRQVCLAMNYAHQQGVLHRDLKPDNIMLKPEKTDGHPYRPVVTDLGLARLVSSEHLTQSNTSMGTPAYVSPEQALGQETDARSDVYSLGILLYELAVGRLPFPARSITEAIRYHTKEAPPPPRSVQPDLPEALESVILRALEKDPAARFSSAAEMAEALNALSANVATSPVLTAMSGEAVAGVSLATVLQASTPAGRGESVLGEFPPTGSTSGQYAVSILSPDHSIRRVSMKPDGLTIGRGAGADIALDDERVSRRHARITFDGANHQVTDLNSANGTYLANFKLLPGVVQAWTPDKPLRVSGYYLRLEQGQVGTDSPIGRIGLFMETTDFTVEPGSSVMLPLTIINQGEVVDGFTVSAQGVPQEWLPGSAPRVELLPGLQQQTALTIKPPRVSQSRAGQYPLVIRVVSGDAPDEFAEFNASLTVEAYHQASSRLEPAEVVANTPAQVRVWNQGNSPEAFHLIWRDQADAVLFTPQQAELSLAEGENEPVAFKARPKRRRWIGGTKQHPFVVQVNSAGIEAQAQSGQMISSGLIPAWALPLIALIALLLCGVFSAPYTRPPTIDLDVEPSNPLANQTVSISWTVTNCQSVELWDAAKLVAKDLPCNGKRAFDQGFPSAPHLRLVASSLFAPVIGPATMLAQVPVATLTPTPTPTSTSTHTPTPTPESPVPVINQWRVLPMQIVRGQSVTIEWNVSNAESAQLSPIGSVPLQGHLSDSPEKNTIYILSAVNKGKTTVSNPIQIVVEVPPTDTPVPPTDTPQPPNSPTPPYLTVIDLNGEWTDGSTRRAVISTASQSLVIDMSAFKRPAAHGTIFNASTIEVTFPDDKSYIGTLLPPNLIRWSNGSYWRKL